MVEIETVEDPDENVVNQLLTTCGFADGNSREKVRERLGLESLSEFSMLKDTNISDLASTLIKASRVTDRVFMTTKQIMFLQGACDWVRDSKKRGIPLEVDDLTPEILVDFIEKKNFTAEKDQSQIASPPKSFDPGR